MSSGNSAPQPLEDDSCMARYYRAPLMTRGVCTMLVWIWLLSLVLYPEIDFWLSGCPGGILSLELWRWFTSPFVGGGLIGVLIGVFVFGNIGGQFERTFGSLAFGYLFMLFNVFANIAFTFAVLIAAPLVPHMALLSPTNCANGVWVSVLGFLVVYTQRLQQPHMSFWGLCNIPTKLYPWFLLLIFGLLGGSFLDNLCGILVGYAFHFGHLHRFIPSEQRFQQWEVWPALNWMTQSPGYLTYTGSLYTVGAGDEGGGGLGNWGSSGSGQSQSRTGNIMSGGVIRPGSAAPQEQRQGPASSSAFSAFQGAGQSLGSASAGGTSPWALFANNNASESTGGGGQSVGGVLNSFAGDNRGTYAVIPPADQTSSSAAPSTQQAKGTGDFSDKVQQLCDMGFAPTLAAAALREHNGDMDAAVASLAA